MKAFVKSWAKVLFCVFFCLPSTAEGQDAAFSAENPESSYFNISTAIEQALRLNTDILTAKASVEAAGLNKKRQFTEFLPKFSTRYGYTRLDDEETFSNIVVSPRDQYQFKATVDQPVFSGFSRQTQYEISGLDLEIQQLLEKQTRQDLVLTVKEAYFTLLQNEKLENVAQETVKQLGAQVRVAEDFYEVGMVPKNDVLEAEVDLANAQQELIVSKNDVDVATSRFNTILRRPVDSRLELEDVLSYEPFKMAYQTAVDKALSLRTEITLAIREVETAKKDIVLAKTGYFPAVDLQGNYYRTGDDPAVNGGEGITDPDEWDMRVVFSWTFWEWGKTRYGVLEKQKRLDQAEYQRIRVEDDIREEVKVAYLRVRAAESNILTTEKAVEQAKENYRIIQERYKEQVATSTDVLNAQTRLTRAQTNYFNTLSVFNIAKALLDRAMGLDVVQ